MAPTTTPARPRPRRRSKPVAPSGRAAAAVLVRPAPPLDPPCDQTQAPPGGMDFLPGDWLAFPRPGSDSLAPDVGLSGTGLSGPGLSGPGLSGPGLSGPGLSGPGLSGPGLGGPGLGGPGLGGPGLGDSRLGGARPAAPAPPDAPAQPPPHAAAQRFVGMCVEILNGYRPAAHLRQVTHPKHCTAVTDQLIRRTVRVRMPPSHAARQGHLVRVRRMLVNEPLPGVAELVAVLEQGPAVWAMAVRLERPARRTPGLSTWLCTLVQVV